MLPIALEPLSRAAARADKIVVLVAQWSEHPVVVREVVGSTPIYHP